MHPVETSVCQIISTDGNQSNYKKQINEEKKEEKKITIHLKSFIAKRVISILVNLRYLRFKLLKYKENN